MNLVSLTILFTLQSVSANCSLPKHGATACSQYPPLFNHDCNPDWIEGSAYDENDSSTHRCLCANEFHGTTCDSKYNDCMSDDYPCGEDLFDGRQRVWGSCEDNIRTIKNQKEYTCTCNDGYEKDASKGSPSDPKTPCKIVNPCDADPCGNDATCEWNGFDGAIGEAGADEYTCRCQPENYGPNCESEHNDCLSNPCGSDNICTDKVRVIDNELHYDCDCVSGYSKNTLNPRQPTCEAEDPCASIPCENGGTCIWNTPGQANSGYTCNCTPEFSGSDCQTKFDDCQPRGVV